MPSITIQSKIWGTTFGTPEMLALFSDERMVQGYLDVEAALARAQARIGVIPSKAGAAITKVAKVERVDWAALQAGTENVGYPVAPLVKQLSGWPDEGMGEYCHWGATTQDIMDTADVLQAREGLAMLEGDLSRLCGYLAELARRYADTPMAGRTHLQHALPISFGYKVVTWLAGLDRHLDRLAGVRERAIRLSFGGAVGTLSSLGNDGLSVRVELARELDLPESEVSWHSVRDGFCEITGWLAMLAASLGKIGIDIALMMQTEVSEVAEPFKPGRGSSSTMPQKRNPVASEKMIAAAKVVREQHSLMLDAMVQDHERATGQWHVEWQALSTAFLMTSAGLSAACDAFEGLEVFPENMKAGLQKTEGLIMAEAVMMGLAPTLGRQRAHDLVERCSHLAISQNKGFRDVLSSQPEISSTLTSQQLDELLDPGNYLGSSGKLVKAYLATRDQRFKP